MQQMNCKNGWDVKVKHTGSCSLEGFIKDDTDELDEGDDEAEDESIQTEDSSGSNQGIL